MPASLSGMVLDIHMSFYMDHCHPRAPHGNFRSSTSHSPPLVPAAAWEAKYNRVNRVNQDVSKYIYIYV